MPYDPQIEEHAKTRKRKLRRWTRFLTVVLIGLTLSAIWQERRLAPPVHDGLQRLASVAIEQIERNEYLSEALVNARKTYANFTEGG